MSNFLQVLLYNIGQCGQNSIHAEVLNHSSVVGFHAWVHGLYVNSSIVDVGAPLYKKSPTRLRVDSF